MILHILHVVARNVESAQQSAQLNGVHLQGQASLIQNLQDWLIWSPPPGL